MRILHTSDWHLGKSLFDFPLVEEQRQFLQFILDIIVEKSVEAVVIAGDIYHRPVPPAWALRLFDDFLSQVTGRLNIPVLAIAGNHDSPDRLEFGSSLYAKSGYYISGTIKESVSKITIKDEFGHVNFYLIPYLYPAQVSPFFPEQQVKTFDEAYRAVLGHTVANLDYSARNVAVAHGFFSNLSGTNPQKELITSDSELSIGGADIADIAHFSPFCYTALGHLHAPQQVSESAFYSGSPLKYSLSEQAQNKCINIVDIDQNGGIQLCKIPCPAIHDVRTVSGTFAQLIEPTYHQNKNFEDYVFAEISDATTLYAMEKLRILFPNLLGLRFWENQTADTAQVLLGAKGLNLPIVELFSRFYFEMKGQEISGLQLALIEKLTQQSEREDGEI